MWILVSQKVPSWREQRDGRKRKVPGPFGSLRSLRFIMRRKSSFLGVGRHQEESGIRPVWGVHKNRAGRTSRTGWCWTGRFWRVGVPVGTFRWANVRFLLICEFFKILIIFLFEFLFSFPDFAIFSALLTPSLAATMLARVDAAHSLSQCMDMMPPKRLQVSWIQIFIQNPFK